MSAGIRIDALHAALSVSARTARRDYAGGVWANATTGLPVGEPVTRYSADATLAPHDVEALLAHDWRARREITQPAGDLIRCGFTLEGLPSWVDVDAVMSWVEGDGVDGQEGNGLLAALGDLWAEGESYGGSVLVAVADDGKPASEPLDVASLRTVASWQVLDRWSVWPYRKGGTASPVDYWIITDFSAEILRSAQIVHPSRLAVHEGMWMPGRWRRMRDGWGLSRLELLRDQRDRLALGLAHLGRLLSRSSQDVVTLAELHELKEAAGSSYVDQRMAVFRSTLSSDGLAVLDGGIEGDPTRHLPGRGSDKFETMARPMGGANDISAVQHEDWRRGSGQPQILADGIASGGLNSGEEAGQWRSWGAWISAEQTRSLTRKLNWGLGLIFASKEGPTGGRVPDEWEVCWTPIAEPDHKVDAEVAEIWANIDVALKGAKLLTDEEIRQWRHVDKKRGLVEVESAKMPETDKPAQPPPVVVPPPMPMREPMEGEEPDA